MSNFPKFQCFHHQNKYLDVENEKVEWNICEKMNFNFVQLLKWHETSVLSAREQTTNVKDTDVGQENNFSGCPCPDTTFSKE